MKNIFLILLAFAATSSFAAEKLICTLVNSKDNSKSASMVIDLEKTQDEQNFPDGSDGVDVGKYSYFFSISEYERSGDDVTFDFYVGESNVVQDEVLNLSLEMSVAGAKSGDVVFAEEIGEDGVKSMDFSCVYDKD